MRYHEMTRLRQLHASRIRFESRSGDQVRLGISASNSPIFNIFAEDRACVGTVVDSIFSLVITAWIFQCPFLQRRTLSLRRGCRRETESMLDEHLASSARKM